jgi:hypothetical protein
VGAGSPGEAIDAGADKPESFQIAASATASFHTAPSRIDPARVFARSQNI